MTLRINDTQHHWVPLCRNFLIVIVNVVRLSIVLLNVPFSNFYAEVIMPIAVMLNVRHQMVNSSILL